MPLAGLIIATEDGCQAAQLPVAGQTLVELVARTLRAAGAGHIVVLVDQLPGPLVAAFDRLRDDGINIDVAREACDAADRIHPEEALLVVSEGIVADLSLIEALSKAERPALLTISAQNSPVGLERIDATDHWTGLALIDGQLLRTTVGTLGDWSLAPTLLRATLAAGARRMSVPDGHIFGRVQDNMSAQALSQRLAKASGSQGQSFVERRIFAPLADKIVPLLLMRAIPADLVGVLPLVLLGSALLLILAGWKVSALAIALLAGLPALVGKTMGQSGLRENRAIALFYKAFLPVVCVIFLILGWQFWSGPAGWGGMVLSLWAVCLLLLARAPKTALEEAEIWLAVVLAAALAASGVAGFGILIAANMAFDLFTRWKER